MLNHGTVSASELELTRRPRRTESTSGCRHCQPETLSGRPLSTEAHWLVVPPLLRDPCELPEAAAVLSVDAALAAARAMRSRLDGTTQSPRRAGPPRPLQVADTWIAWASKWMQHFGACWVELLRPDDGDDDHELEDADRLGSPRSVPSPQPVVVVSYARAVDSTSS